MTGKIDIQLEYLEDLTQLNLDIVSLDGRALSGQDILNAVAEVLLLKWDHYDLEGVPEDMN